MEESDLLWAMLPDGLREFFDLESFRKEADEFAVTLLEKNKVPDNLPEIYWNKKIEDSTVNSFSFDDFPIRGRKGKIILKRRLWKFEGVDRWLKREINLCAEGTKLEKEFAVFLKEFDRD